MMGEEYKDMGNRERVMEIVGQTEGQPIPAEAS